MTRLILPALPVILLCACSPSAVSLQPGMWETSVQFNSIDMPGAPPQQVAAMRAMMSQPHTSSSCMTAAEAANPTQRMMNPASNGNACRFTESTFAGGTIRVRGSCEAPGRGTSTTNMDGTYTATTMQATMSSEIHAPPGTPGPQSVRMSGTLNAHRTGDCPG